MYSASIALGGAINRPLQDQTVAESQSAEFECEVANASARGKWLKDGQVVDFSDNIRSEDKGAVRRLIIVITRTQDVGEYTYQVANSKTTANLKVEGEYHSLIFSFKRLTMVSYFSNHVVIIRFFFIFNLLIKFN